MNINEKLTHEEQLRVAIDRITDERDELLRQRDLLLRAVFIGLAEMKTWESLEECDCPPEGHICGMPRLQKHIREVQTVIAECEKGASHD